jgi:hypothetical protein
MASKFLIIPPKLISLFHWPVPASILIILTYLLSALTCVEASQLWESTVLYCTIVELHYAIGITQKYLASRHYLCRNKVSTQKYVISHNYLCYDIIILSFAQLEISNVGAL